MERKPPIEEKKQMHEQVHNTTDPRSNLNHQARGPDDQATGLGSCKQVVCVLKEV